MTITTVPDKKTIARREKEPQEVPRAPARMCQSSGPCSCRNRESVIPTGVSAAAVMWRRFVLFLAGVGAIFGIIETGLWLTEEGVVHQPEFVRRQVAPYVEFYSEPNFHEGGIDTNEAGFRYGPLPVTKPVGEKRIFFLSSSVGFRGATNETTIAGFMEQQLASLVTGAGRRIRVINASGTSFCPTQSLVLLVTRVLAYGPDVIVVFHGPEALLYPTVYESRPGYPFNFRVRERLQEGLAGNLEGSNPLISLLMRTRLMRRFHPDLGREARQAELARYNNVITIDSLEQYNPYISAVVGDVESMVKIASAYGCRTLVAIPPWRSPALLPGGVERLADRLRSAIATLGRNDLHFADTTGLTEEMNARGSWRADSVHWDDEGNELIAACLTKALVDAGFLD